uniref:Interleukin-6 n=1 Tax=Podarcis muralis TaxID=64176 RepID=A0A670IA31_PODMU
GSCLRTNAGSLESVTTGPNGQGYLYLYYTSMNLATWLKHVATEWDKELCEKSGGCECQGDDHPNFPFGIPEITAADRCQPEHAFDKETCLRALASGLFHMEVFVKYIEQTLVSERPPTYSWITAKHLANTLKSLMEDPETVTYPDAQVKDSYSQMLASYTDFRTVVIKHLILQGYEGSVRACKV